MCDWSVDFSTVWDGGGVTLLRKFSVCLDSGGGDGGCFIDYDDRISNLLLVVNGSDLHIHVCIHLFVCSFSIGFACSFGYGKNVSLKRYIHSFIIYMSIPLCIPFFSFGLFIINIFVAVAAILFFFFFFVYYDISSSSASSSFSAVNVLGLC